MNKGLDKLFSKEELKILKEFTLDAVREDRRIHGIPDNETNRNNITFPTMGNFQIVQQNPGGIPELHFGVRTSPQIKKGETKINDIYQQKPKPQKIEEEKNESLKPSKKIDNHGQIRMNDLTTKIEYANIKRSPAPKEEIKKTPENQAFHRANTTQNKKPFNHNVNTKVENTNKVEPQKKIENQKLPKIEQPKKKEQPKPKIEEKKEMGLSKSQNVEFPNKTESSKSQKVETKKKVESPKTLPKNLEQKKQIQQTVSSIPKISSPIKLNINSQIINEQNAKTNNPVNGNTGVPPPPPPPPEVPKPSINMEQYLQIRNADREQELNNVHLRPIAEERNIDINNNNGNERKNFLERALSDAIRNRKKNLHMHDDKDDDNDDKDDWD